MSLQRVVDEAVASTPGVRWSIAITGRTAAADEPDRRLPTAGTGTPSSRSEAGPSFEADRRRPTA